MTKAARRGGRFVTFEGIEGSGKTTQIDRLARALAASGVETVVTHEPGATRLGKALRALLLSKRAPAVSASAEVLLFTADRAQHLEEIVLPALRRGAVVLCDRYLDATLAYQGYARGLGAMAVLDLHRRAPLSLRPDRTVLFDHDPAKGLARAKRRDRATTGAAAAAEGRMEDESLAFHRRVRAGYLALARKEPRRIRVVRAAGSVTEVEARVRHALVDLIPELHRTERSFRAARSAARRVTTRAKLQSAR